MKSRLIFAAVMLVTSATISLSDDMTGQASIIDGDTLEIHDNRIRLWGVDAPESDQLCRGEDSLQYRCGAKAANELDAFIAKRPVNCIPISLDQYGRTVATCSVGGADLGEWLVRNGLALDWPQYSRGRYDAVEREAEHAGRGFGRGAMSSRGCSASAFEQVGRRVNVPMMPTPALEKQAILGAIVRARRSRIPPRISG